MQDRNTTEVFKTDVQEEHEHSILETLCDSFPHFNINFDLEDCDRILRVKGNNVCAEQIIALMRAKRFLCEALE